MNELEKLEDLLELLKALKNAIEEDQHAERQEEPRKGCEAGKNLCDASQGRRPGSCAQSQDRKGRCEERQPERREDRQDLCEEENCMGERSREEDDKMTQFKMSLLEMIWKRDAAKMAHQSINYNIEALDLIEYYNCYEAFCTKWGPQD